MRRILTALTGAGLRWASPPPRHPPTPHPPYLRGHPPRQSSHPDASAPTPKAHPRTTDTATTSPPESPEPSPTSTPHPAHPCPSTGLPTRHRRAPLPLSLHRWQTSGKIFYGPGGDIGAVSTLYWAPYPSLWLTTNAGPVYRINAYDVNRNSVGVTYLSVPCGH